MRADFGLNTPGGPVWLRDNPFLLKSGRTEARRLSLLWRVAATVVLLGGILVGGLALQARYGGTSAQSILQFAFHASFPVVLFVLLSFVHALLLANARASAAVSLADEARRGTLPDLLLTPLRRAEMVLAMGVGPARAAFVVALAGLPVYVLLGQFGGLTGRDAACLYLLLGLLCYQPPMLAAPALSGLAQTPDAPPGQFAALPNRRTVRRASYLGIGFPFVLGFLFLGRFLGSIGGGWLTHLFSALHLPLLSGFSFLIFFTWPYYAAQILSDRLPFFHVMLSPLWYVLPLIGMQWAGSALGTAAALSAGSGPEVERLPVGTRAQTLRRWTARLAGVCALGVVWRAWVESGDTAGLAQTFASGPNWDAAGLLLLLGGCSLPNVCGRALAAAAPGTEGVSRAFGLTLRRAVRRSLRPLGVAGAAFLIACLLGGLSPFASAVYEAAGKVALAGVSTAVWAAGVRRAGPRLGKWAVTGLLYAAPLFALSVPGLSPAAALSPVSAWVRLFAGGPGLMAQFPLWHLGPLPPFWVCAAAPLFAGAALLTPARRPVRQDRAAFVNFASLKKRVPARNEARTAALMGWVTRRTDNPLFIYEIRTRTRSGRWLDWLLLTSLVFAASVVAALIFPDVVQSFSFLSPFRFFHAGPHPLIELASLLLLIQCYALVFRGPVLGEMLIAKDRQQGTWGFLLLTPLSMRQIFRGKIAGQTAAIGVLWAACGLGSLALYALSAPAVGLGPALEAWASGQALVAGVFTLGVSVGTALAAFPAVQKTLKGLSTLLFVLIVGGMVYAMVVEAPDGWSLAVRLCGGSLVALGLSAAFFRLAEWRLSVLRGRDIAAKDGVG